jgi:hypothetical protein
MPLPTSHVFHRPFQPDIGPQDSKTSRSQSRGTRQSGETWRAAVKKRFPSTPSTTSLRANFDLGGDQRKMPTALRPANDEVEPKYIAQQKNIAFA